MHHEKTQIENCWLLAIINFDISAKNAYFYHIIYLSNMTNLI